VSGLDSLLGGLVPRERPRVLGPDRRHLGGLRRGDAEAFDDDRAGEHCSAIGDEVLGTERWRTRF